MGLKAPAVATDAIGNAYNCPLLYDGSFLFSKLDALGNLLWTKSSPPCADGCGFQATRLAIDSVGNCFFSGTLYGTAVFDIGDY
jgi:hypothetical protein